MSALTGELIELVARNSTSILKNFFSKSSTIFSLLTSSSLMKKPHDDHIKRPMNAFMVSVE